MTYRKIGERFFAENREPFPLAGDTLTVRLAGERGEGTLWLNGRGHFVKDGLCAVPCDALREGENTMCYTSDGGRADVDAPIRLGETLFFAEKTVYELCLYTALQAQETKNRLARMTERIEALEKQCFGPSLFGTPGKDLTT